MARNIKKISSLLVISLLLKLQLSFTKALNSPLESLVTIELLKNIQIESNITDLFCSLKIIGEHPFPFEWKHFEQVSEPIQLFIDYSGYNYTSPQSKFKTPCYYFIVYITSADRNLQLRLKNIGRLQEDKFVFLSYKSELLSSLMNSKEILDSVAHKYGIALSSDMHTSEARTLQTKISYLVEPRSYTGTMIISEYLDWTYLTKWSLLNGRKLKVAYYNLPLYVENIGHDILRGIEFKLVHEISLKANITLTFYNNTRTPGFGVRLKTGEWTGVVDEVGSGRADFTPTMGPTLERYQYISYTTAAYVETLLIYLKYPKTHRPWHALIDPLTPLVWIMTLISYVVVVFLVILKVTFETQFKLISIEQKKLENLGKTAFFLCYTHFIEQTCKIPKYLHSRPILIMWIYFSYVIGSAYKSNLVSFLTFSEKENVPKTFEELHRNKAYDITLFSVGGMELELLKTSPSPIMKGIVKRMSVTKSTIECLYIAAKPRQVCIGWKGFVSTEIVKNSMKVKEFNQIMVTSEPGGVAYGCIAFKKNSMYPNSFSKYVGGAVSGYLTYIWRESYWRTVRKEAMDQLRNESEFKIHKRIHPERHHKLNLGDLFVVFVVVFGGLLASLCSLIYENSLNLLKGLA